MSHAGSGRCASADRRDLLHRRRPGRLVHADEHGFILVPEEHIDRLLEAAQAVDDPGCKKLIDSRRSVPSRTLPGVLRTMDGTEAAGFACRRAASARAGRSSKAPGLRSVRRFP